MKSENQNLHDQALLLSARRMITTICQAGVTLSGDLALLVQDSSKERIAMAKHNIDVINTQFAELSCLFDLRCAANQGKTH